ncbi:DUF6206 family protein [Pacificoceanicola onchidii]|uniref:DUF6206 family protein n=1 Tax=Pacificoceanicola onchidii TaxID=2562685 RepID=UPI0010A5F110|nr:DUF6206 family protein [Pacificoceanicola onchidii]
MTDLAALADLIRADSASRGQTISKLGYFCAPFQPRSGPFADKVIKVYRGLPDAEALDKLKRCHDHYVEALNAADVGLPETEFHLLEMDGARIPVIVQAALPTDRLMRPLMQAGSRDETLEMMEAAGVVIARFWHWAEGSNARVGFHPSIRNFAYVDGTARFFDTFPPLIHYSRDEMGKLLLLFSEKRLMRMVGPFLQTKVTGIQDEWYSPPETLVGLVGSACRLRPEFAQDYLSWGRDFAAREMQPWAEEAIAGMKTPPRLPGYWTGFRKILGLQGAPNIDKT